VTTAFVSPGKTEKVLGAKDHSPVLSEVNPTNIAAPIVMGWPKSFWIWTVTGAPTPTIQGPGLPKKTN
jgi:hypothetical protein